MQTERGYGLKVGDHVAWIVRFIQIRLLIVP